MSAEKMKELLSEIKDLGCSCDVMYGFYCQIHIPVQRLHEQLDVVFATLKRIRPTCRVYTGTTCAERGIPHLMWCDGCLVRGVLQEEARCKIFLDALLLRLLLFL